MMSFSTTIAAISTATGGGVGIVRVSGPLAQHIGQAVCAPWPASLQSHHLYKGQVFDSKKESIDHVLFCMMLAPHSYTGEDVLEIHAHGGAVVLHQVLEAVLQAGGEPAAPGEFTKRAFLQGKLDLTQAEAVAAMIAAQSVQATRHAKRQLSGDLGKQARDLRNLVIGWLGRLEGGLDFPDLEEDQRIESTALQELQDAHKHLEHLAHSFSAGGKALQSGIQVALMGKTNAGKSSLINALCQDERVLVDAQPGTTRDVIEIRTKWNDVAVALIDTAGARADATPLEQQGLRLAKKRGQLADVVMLVVDGTQGLGQEERDLLHELGPQVPYVIAWNKMDQATCLPLPKEEPAVACSALCGWGLTALQQHILQRVAPALTETTVVVSARQAALLQQAASGLKRALLGLQHHLPWDLLAAELRQTATALGELTGEEATEAVIDAIFAQFCIGK